jgi:hypothetical protein
MEFAESAITAIDNHTTGVVIESTKTRTVWLGGDLRVSIVERRTDQVLVVVGAPISSRARIADDVWNAWTVGP